jgi:phi13 family phage major tail protein
MAGVVVGLRDLHYAVLSADTSVSATYAAPKTLAAAISAKITPNTSSATLYANDVAIATSNAMGAVDVTLEIDQIPAAVLNELLGITKDANGVLKFDDQVNAPYVALGFRAPLSGGGYRYVWLSKGKFSIPEDQYNTKGDKVEFQTKSISGQFVTREFDKVWKVEVDSNDVTDPTVIDGWFTTVYQPA